MAHLQPDLLLLAVSKQNQKPSKLELFKSFQIEPFINEILNPTSMNSTFVLNNGTEN